MITRTSSYIFLVALLWSALLFAHPPTAEAGVIYGPPVYLGLGNGLVGYWTFDGADMSVDSSRNFTAYDRSGNGNNGIFTNSPVPTAGKIGQGLGFDGVTQNFHVPNAASVDNLTQKTISAWFKTSTTSDPTGGVQTIMAKHQCGATLTWDLVVNTDKTLVFSQRWDNQRGIWATTNTITFGVWHHVVVTYDRSSTANDAVIYVDGVKQALTITSPTGVHQDDSANHIDIGATGNDTGVNECSYFVGSLDDVRLYNRLLNADEIKRLYNIGGTLHFGRPTSNGTLSNGLIGWWTMDGADTSRNGSGTTTVVDRSGNGNLVQTVNAQHTPLLVNGKIGQGMRFDGASTYIGAAHVNALDNATAVSVSVWAKTSTSTKLDGQERHIVDQSLCSGSSATSFEIASDPLGGSEGKVFGYFGMQGGNDFTPDSNSRIDDAKWHNIVSVDDPSRAAGDQLVLYLDGVYQGSQRNSTGPLNDTSGVQSLLQIGGWCNGAAQGAASARPWLGDIDDVRIWNRALTASEVKRLYNLGGTLHQGVASSNGSLSQGLVGYWTMDGKDTSVDGSGIVTVIDRSGNNSHAITDTAATAPARTLGRIGQAMLFSGAQYLAILSDPANLAITTSFTIVAWVNSNIINAGTVFGRADSNTDGYTLAIDGGSDCTDGTYNVIETTLGSAIPGFVGWCGGTRMTLGKWYHVATVYNSVAQTIHSYVNGVEDGGAICGSCGDTTIPTSFNPSAVGTPAIGADGGNVNNKFNGSIDDVRIWNRALSASEIKRLYNMGR